MYKGIIFDLDGTLLDTIEDISDSMNQVLRAMGRKEFSYDQYKLKVGGGFRKLVINALGEDEEEDLIDQVLEEYRLAYGENYMNKSRPYEGIKDLVLELEKRGIKLAINTNKDQEYSENLVGRHFESIDFLEIVGQRKGLERKPSPEGASLALKVMGLKKSEVLYIGDSDVDVMTGHSLGVKVVGVAWGFRGEDELRRSGADFIVHKPEDILAII